MNKNHLSAVIAVIVSTCAQAASFWIRPDKSDWNDAESYWDGQKVPAKGDIVNIGAQDNTLTYGTESWNLAQKFDSIGLEGSSSTLIFDVPAGSVATNYVKFGKYDVCTGSGVGTIVKKGGGTLVLFPDMGNIWWMIDGISCMFNAEHVKVEDGSLVLSAPCRMGMVEIGSGAVFSPSDSSCIGGVSGSGTVANQSGGGLTVAIDRASTGIFSGTLDPGIRFDVKTAGAKITLSNGARAFTADNGTGVIAPVSIAQKWGIGGDSTFNGEIMVESGDVSLFTKPRYYKWIVQQCWGAEVDAEGNKVYGGYYYGIFIEEFGLFDKDGQRVNTGLVHGLQPGNLAPGEAAFVDCFHSDGYDYTPAGSAGNTGNLFNGTDDAVAWRIMPRANIELSNPNSSVTLMMHLTDGAAASVSSYDFANGAENGNYIGYHPSRWQMRGSFDGAAWFTVDGNGEARAPAVDGKGYHSNCWNRPDADGNFVSCAGTAPHTTGYPLDYSAVGAPETLGGIRVAQGASLSSDGEAAISSLTIDAQDGGDLNGFVLADSGTLNIVNASRARPLTLPGDYGGGISLDKLRRWKITVNGREIAPSLVSLQDGKIVLFPCGMLIKLL